MIIKVKFNGSEYAGKHFQELVQAMKLQSYVQEQDKSEYMSNVTTRVENFRGAQISYNSCREFIMELIRVGTIEDMVIKRNEGNVDVYSLESRRSKK